MITLVEFLCARLAEDEQVARAVDDNSAPWVGEWRSDAGNAVRTRNGWVLVMPPRPGAELRPGLATHIARHDPARVLAEVDAKRQIIDLTDTVRAWTDGAAGATAGYAAAVVDKTLRLLALPWAGHEAYRKEWAPE